MYLIFDTETTGLPKNYNAFIRYKDILHDKEFVLSPTTESLLVRQRNAIRETLETAYLYEEEVS